MRTPVGQRRDRILFKYLADTGETDDYGNPIVTEFIYGPFWCRVQPLKGSETVIAARLTGKQPVIVTAPWSPAIANMKSDWTMTDDAGKVYDLKSVANMDERKQFLEILAEVDT